MTIRGSVADRRTLVSMYRKMSLLKQNDEQARAVILSGKLMMIYYSRAGRKSGHHRCRILHRRTTRQLS